MQLKSSPSELEAIRNEGITQAMLAFQDKLDFIKKEPITKDNFIASVDLAESKIKNLLELYEKLSQLTARVALSGDVKIMGIHQGLLKEISGLIIGSHQMANENGYNVCFCRKI